MTSCGATLLPSDFDILRPSSSIDEAVGQHLVERRASARADADEQRALEPAAMLVAALEVDVGRPAMVFAERQHRLVARARVEPDVEDVRARARTTCRRTTGRSGRRARTPRAAARTRRRRRRCRTPRRRARRAPCVSTASPHVVQSIAGIGTPHARWREMHQSGRLAIMPSMRRAAPGRDPARRRRSTSRRLLAQVLRCPWR